MPMGNFDTGCLVFKKVFMAGFLVNSLAVWMFHDTMRRAG